MFTFHVNWLTFVAAVVLKAVPNIVPEVVSEFLPMLKNHFWIKYSKILLINSIFSISLRSNVYYVGYSSILFCRFKKFYSCLRHYQIGMSQFRLFQLVNILNCSNFGYVFYWRINSEVFHMNHSFSAFSVYSNHFHYFLLIFEFRQI